MATRKKAVKKAPTKRATKKAPAKVEQSPEEFIRGVVEDVVFRDGSLEEADAKIAEFFEGRKDRERESLGRRLVPILSRLTSAAPSLSTMVSSRAQ